MLPKKLQILQIKLKKLCIFYFNAGILRTIVSIVGVDFGSRPEIDILVKNLLRTHKFLMLKIKGHHQEKRVFVLRRQFWVDGSTDFGCRFSAALACSCRPR
jgi:hypothetical protein